MDQLHGIAVPWVRPPLESDMHREIGPCGGGRDQLRHSEAVSPSGFSA